MDPSRPPLPHGEPVRASDPPLPPTEPLSHPRPSKRLGIGNADGSKRSTGPPSKKSRKLTDSNGLGNKPQTISAEELQALEDGELEDSDDSGVTGVKETYLVIDKKARKRSPGSEVRRRESMDFEETPSEAEHATSKGVALPVEHSPQPLKKEPLSPELAKEADLLDKPKPNSMPGFFFLVLKFLKLE